MLAIAKMLCYKSRSVIIILVTVVLEYTKIYLYNPNKFTTIFTWFNAPATISHLCKMTAATMQGRLLFEGGIYCNVLMITMAII